MTDQPFIGDPTVTDLTGLAKSNDRTPKPVAYLVIKEPGEKWHFARTREDADHLANNLLTYVRGCTNVRIQALGFLSEEVRMPRTYGESRP